MSGAWLWSNGVGTAMMNTSAGAISVEATSSPRDTTPWTSPSRSTSSMWISPRLIVSTTDCVTSTPRTLQPARATTAAVEDVTPVGARHVWAAVFLVMRGKEFGYKDMCESMGPCEDGDALRFDGHGKCVEFVEYFMELPERLREGR